MKKRISVTIENEFWRNLEFHDNFKKIHMTRKSLVNKIEKWEYPKYHIRKINWIKTPVSNPDKKTNNNLW